MDDELLQPHPDSMKVNFHPHAEGDLVSVSFEDAATLQRFALVFTPWLADELATLLATAVSSPQLANLADELRRNGM